MKDDVFDVHNTSIQLMMVVRMQELKRTGLPTLRYSDLEEYLEKSLWKRGCPKTLNRAADDVMHVSANDIVRYMSFRAVVDGSSGKLEDFTDLFGGLE